MKKNKNIVLIILLSLLAINLIVFAVQFNQFSFVAKWIPIVINIVMLLLLGWTIYIGYKHLWYFVKEKKTIGITILVIVLNVFLLVGNISSNWLDRAMVNMTTDRKLYSSTVIVLKESPLKKMDDLKNVKIGVSDNQNDYENYLLIYNELKKKDQIDNNEFFPYNDYLIAIQDLLDGHIDALVISSNYQTLYDEYFENLDEKVREIGDVEYVEKDLEKNKSSVNRENPFTILVIGADTLSGGFNADVQILMTVNPTTKKVIQVDVVRDTYAYNVRAKKMDKMTHTGWNGPTNVVDSVSLLFDIEIDYYIKFNFNSVIDIVDMMGGLTMNVPYQFYGDKNSTYTVSPGVKHLSGTETLMLARTRRMPGSNLQSRGRMQMQIIDALTKQVDSQFLLKNFFQLFDLATTNIETNIPKQDMYYLIQKYVGIKNDFEFDSNTLYGYNSSFYHEGIRAQLYTYIPDETSLKELSSKLKENLK